MTYQVILEPGIGQFREFEPLRVHTHSYIFVGTFSRAQIDLRKAREREIATFDGAVGLLEPYVRDKNSRQEPGGRRDDTCDHGLSRSWKVEVCNKYI